MKTLHVAAAALLAGILAAVPSALQAQNCKKGKPCGRSCIAQDKVCRIGAPTPPPASRPVAKPDTASSGAATRLGIAAIGLPDSSAVHPDSTWVASFADAVYFRTGCVASKDLAPANRRYFRSEDAAKAAGYRRSQTPGC